MSLGPLMKDPQEVRDYTFDWTDHLGDDTIAAATVTVRSGLTKVSDGIVAGGKRVTVRVSGGTLGSDYDVTCTVTTATSGELLERSGVIRVRHL